MRWKNIIFFFAVLFIWANLVSAATEVKRDGRFIAYDNGTVLDTRTNLMWAAKDNGSDINWVNAKPYCDNYRGGGYTDWRMPTLDELAGLHDSAVKNNIELDNLLQLTGIYWASETRGSEAATCHLLNGAQRAWTSKSDLADTRALPVRSGK